MFGACAKTRAVALLALSPTIRHTRQAREASSRRCDTTCSKLNRRLRSCGRVARKGIVPHREDRTFRWLVVAVSAAMFLALRDIVAMARSAAR
jgi:hypothetical protein